MNEKLSKEQIITIILGEEADDLMEEDVIHLLIERKVSADPSRKQNTLGQRAADKLAKFAGSWPFIGIFAFVLIAWMVINAVLLTKPFDPYPFILLNLVLSCIAAIQAPIIMMSQNRQEEKDRLRAENDYRVNLKTELIIEDLHQKLDALAENQKEIMEKLEKKE